MNEYDQPKLTLPKRLIDRKELTTVWSYLDSRSPQPLAITGPPGIGKTTIALQAHESCVADGWQNVWSLRKWEHQSFGLVLTAMSIGTEPKLLIIDDIDTWSPEQRSTLLDQLFDAQQKSLGSLRCLILARKLPPSLKSRVELLEIGPFGRDETVELLGLDFPDSILGMIQGNPLTINLLKKLAASSRIPLADMLSDLVHGDEPPAIRVPPAKALWVPKPAAIEVVREFSEEYFKEVSRNPQVTYQLSPRRFEQFIAAVWERLGWTVELTKQTRDGGADIVAVRSDLGTQLKVLIEAKRYAPDRPVSVGLIRQLYSVRETKGATKAILATTSYFTPDCRREFMRFVPYTLEFHDLHEIQKWVRQAMQE